MGIFFGRQCPPGTQPYVIKTGDTFYSIAQRFNTTVSAIISANPLVNPNLLQIGQTICIPGQKTFPACPEGNYYFIQPGDTFYSIARRFNVSLDDLLEANPGVDPGSLAVGQIICIPLATPPVTCPQGSIVYTVMSGDTFYSIAVKYNISVEKLVTANPTVRPDALLIGQKICIPKSP